MQTLEAILAAMLVAMVLYIVWRQISAARAERALRESNQFASEIISSAGEGIIVYDRQLRYVVWNRFMQELTGMAAEEVLGRRAGDVFPHLREQHIEELIERAMQGEAVASPDVRYYVPGTNREGWVSAVYRPHYNDLAQIVGVIALVRDVTERKVAEQRIEYQAYHDALTGLANRRLFQEHLALALALAARRGRLVSVLFLDIDHFKLVNDTLGHTLGDVLLRDVATRVKDSVREGDAVARVGGDEFTIVLQDLERRDDAAIVAQKVLNAIGQPIEISGHKLYVTASIGITLFPDDGTDAETLLKNADTAMYRAKAEGRNTYRMSTNELNRSTEERLTIENGLHQAMERSEFELLYQPQVDLTNMRITGMEALLRWRHPERGIMSPASFISVAEERGFIVLIGDWVLRTACLHTRALRDRGWNNLRVAVNLSARQMREKTLIRTVEMALEESGLEPAALELEITESVAMENVDLTLAVMSALRRIGISIAIDDFGTGHSSLAYLKRFPIDTLKIDRSFVEDLPEGYEDAAIVRSVIQLARGLNLRVVAEGVEREEQMQFLRRNDCAEVQGYFFGYPMPIAQMEGMLGSGDVGRALQPAPVPTG